MRVRLTAIVMWVRLIAIVTSRGEEEGAQRKVVQSKVHKGRCRGRFTKGNRERFLSSWGNVHVLARCPE